MKKIKAYMLFYFQKVVDNAITNVLQYNYINL